MHIGIDVRCLMSPNYSGVPEYTANLLKNIFLLDQHNQYKLFYNSKTDVSQNLPQFSQANVKYYGYRYPNKLFNLSLKLLGYPQIDQLLKPLDLFFMPNLNFVALSAKCSKVITIHDLSFIRYSEFYNHKRNWWHKIINPQKLINQFDKIIVDSLSTKNDVIDLLKISAEKIRVIPLGVDHQLYKILDKSEPKFRLIKDRYKLPASFLLFLGTIEPRKNISSLIEAFNLLKQDPKFKELYLVIAGSTGWKFEEIFKLAQNSPFAGQIKFIGYVKKDDKPYLFNLAKIFIFPSHYEGFGLPVLEAQACGTAVIACANSSFPEVLADSALLIKPLNLTEITFALQEMLDNDQLRQELIAKGLINAKKYHWAKTAQNTLDFLQK